MSHLSSMVYLHLRLRPSTFSRKPSLFIILYLYLHPDYPYTLQNAALCIQTPAVLQLSGIGPVSLLDALGIDIVVPLEGVGRGMLEQVRPNTSLPFAH